ncbi:MAG: lipopolysaccharide biosynthesis protein [Flavitalea sp.]
MKVPQLINTWIGKYKESILLNRLLSVLGIDIIFKVSGIILLPVYLRLMTQEEYGLYSYLVSIVLTFSLVLNFGLYIPFSKFYHDMKQPDKIGKLLFTTYSLLFGILIFIMFGIYFFKLDFEIVKILFKNPLNYSHYRLGIMLAIIVTVLNFMLTNYFFTSERIQPLKKYNIARIVLINVVTLGLLYIFSHSDKVKVRLESTYIVELILLIIFSAFVYKEIRPTFDWKLATDSLKLGAPVMLSAIFGIVINFSDKFFLEKFGNYTDLSNYYLAVSCSAVIPMIFASVQNAWLPSFLKEKDIAKNYSRTKKMVVKLLLLFSGLSIAMVIFVQILLYTRIIPMKYQEVIYILPILLVSQIIAALVPLYTNYLIYFEKTYIVSITGFFICFVIFGASKLLIPKFGVYGAAVVSVLSNLTYFMAYFFIIRKLSKNHIYR